MASSVTRDTSWSSGSTFMTALLLILIYSCDTGWGCTFDCRVFDDTFNVSHSAGYCEGPAPELMLQRISFDVKASIFEVMSVLDSVGGLIIPETYLIVDLHGRNITSIATDGFSCYEFVPYDVLNGDTWTQFNSSEGMLRGVNLDDNALMETPEFTSAGLTNATYISMNNNSISAIGTPFMQTDGGSGFLVVSLNQNLINSAVYPILNITRFVQLAFLTVDDNEISSIPNGFLNVPRLPSEPYFADTIIYFSAQNNQIHTLEDGMFNGTSLYQQIAIILSNNPIADAQKIYEGYTLKNNLYLNLENCSINASMFRTMLQSYTTNSGYLFMDLDFNEIGELTDGTFVGVGNGLPNTFIDYFPSIGLSMRFNNLGALESNVFSVPSPFNVLPGPLYNAQINSLYMDLSYNPIVFPIKPFQFHMTSTNGYQTITNLTLSFKGCNLDILPMYLWRAYGATSFSLEERIFYLNLDYSENYITAKSLQMNDHQAANVMDDDIDDAIDNLSNISAEEVTRIPARLESNVLLSLSLQSNLIYEILPNSLNGFAGSVDLSNNRISILSNHSFANMNLESIDLSNNLITFLGVDAFNTSLSLTTLNLAGNQLKEIPKTFTDQAPVLKNFIVKNNQIVALPFLVGNNRIFFSDNANGNVLTCEQYEPFLQNCTCKPGSIYSRFCEYGRCLPTASGCPDGYHKTGDCSVAPYSECISKCPEGQYLTSNTLEIHEASCEVLDDCETKFGPDTKGYEFRPPSLTSNRVCSACSICPVGFDFVPCTATSNTVCTKTDKLSNGDIGAIFVTMILVFATGVGGTSYAFLRKKKVKTEKDLELSQLLLSEVSEDNERLKKAWEISEGDLYPLGKLATGSFGEVWSAEWGHIKVAVKVLHPYLVDFSDELDEFNREAEFMQSIRHPNLLIFYGAGIREDHSPFLVVEFMAKGSMRSLILEENLDWKTRHRFALEISQGMAHLHRLGSMHRDLKSDNCLVDERYHVKVGDFGTSRLRRSDDVKVRQFNTNDLSATMTKGVGTPLWMAPELLEMDGNYGKEVDVYSFAIVMWELLVRKRPWDKEFSGKRYANHFQFCEELSSLILQGVRPYIPESMSSDSACQPYIELMKRCWATDPSMRPTMQTCCGLLQAHGSSSSH